MHKTFSNFKFKSYKNWVRKMSISAKIFPEIYRSLFFFINVQLNSMGLGIYGKDFATPSTKIQLNACKIHAFNWIYISHKQFKFASIEMVHVHMLWFSSKKPFQNKRNECVFVCKLSNHICGNIQ